MCACEKDFSIGSLPRLGSQRIDVSCAVDNLGEDVYRFDEFLK